MRTNRPPTTIQEVYGIFQQNWTPPSEVARTSGSLCIEGPSGTCIDTGGDSRCDAIGFSGGNCWAVPALFQPLGLEPCECVCNPPWYEVALLALIALILFATPGPDEIPGILAAISRFIVRAVPASS